MTPTHTLATILAVSGLALAPAFSVPRPPTSKRIAAPVADTRFTATRRTVVSASAASDATDTAARNEISFLDEIDGIFDCVDTNGDGEISPDELRAHLVSDMGYSTAYADYLFESIDTDASGSISREELGFAFYNFEALSMYMTFGVGGAEITQKASFEKMALKGQRDKLRLDDLADLIFDMIDTDQSGEITREELQAHFDKVTAKLDAGKGAAKQQADEYVQMMFATLDADKDGNICREEIRSAFEKYDFKLLAQVFGLKVYQNALV